MLHRPLDIATKSGRSQRPETFEVNAFVPRIFGHSILVTDVLA